MPMAALALEPGLERECERLVELSALALRGEGVGARLLLGVAATLTAGAQPLIQPLTRRQ